MIQNIGAMLIFKYQLIAIIWKDPTRRIALIGEASWGIIEKTRWGSLESLELCFGRSAQGRRCRVGKDNYRTQIFQV